MFKDYIASRVTGANGINYAMHSGAVNCTVYYLPKNSKIGNYQGGNC